MCGSVIGIDDKGTTESVWASVQHYYPRENDDGWYYSSTVILLQVVESLGGRALFGLW